MSNLEYKVGDRVRLIDRISGQPIGLTGVIVKVCWKNEFGTTVDVAFDELKMAGYFMVNCDVLELAVAARSV